MSENPLEAFTEEDLSYMVRTGRVWIFVDELVDETPKAIGCKIGDRDGPTTWIPKSQIRGPRPSLNGDRLDINIDVTEWYARMLVSKSKNLDDAGLTGQCRQALQALDAERARRKSR